MSDSGTAFAEISLRESEAPARAAHVRIWQHRPHCATCATTVVSREARPAGVG